MIETVLQPIPQRPILVVDDDQQGQEDRRRLELIKMSHFPFRGSPNIQVSVSSSARLKLPLPVQFGTGNCGAFRE